MRKLALQENLCINKIARLELHKIFSQTSHAYI